MAASSTSLRHPIGVVARRTGLKPGLIRAWERRYGAVEPGRTESNRRLYSDRDVERLLLLREVTRLGHPISQVADLPEEELEGLIEAERRLPHRTASLPGASTSHSAAASSTAPAAPATPGLAARQRWGEDDRRVAASLVEVALAAVGRLDARDLEIQLERGALALSRLGVVSEVLDPLLAEVEVLRAEGRLRPVQVGLAHAVARTYLGAIQRASQAPPSGPHLVVGAPLGQRRESRALMAAVMAAAQGWQTTCVGPDLAAEEIAAAAHACGARAVVLGIEAPPGDDRLGEELQGLRRLLPQGTALLATGRPLPPEAGSRAAAEWVEDLAALRRRLDELRFSPPAPRAASASRREPPRSKPSATSDRPALDVHSPLP